jgi:hypothetical protein
MGAGRGRLIGHAMAETAISQVGLSQGRRWNEAIALVLLVE